MTLTGVKYSKPRKETDNLKSETEFYPLQDGYGIKESQTQFDVWR